MCGIHAFSIYGQRSYTSNLFPLRFWQRCKHSYVYRNNLWRLLKLFFYEPLMLLHFLNVAYLNFLNFNKFKNESTTIYPLSLSKRITKDCWVECTIPSFLMARLRLVDFFVKMWRLKGFWKLIRPVPVTLKRFFAL